MIYVGLVILARMQISSSRGFGLAESLSRLSHGATQAGMPLRVDSEHSGSDSGSGWAASGARTSP